MGRLSNKLIETLCLFLKLLVGPTVKHIPYVLNCLNKLYCIFVTFLFGICIIMFFVRKSDNTKSFYELLQTHKTKLKLQNFIHYTFYTKLIITDKTDDAILW